MRSAPGCGSLRRHRLKAGAIRSKRAGLLKRAARATRMHKVYTMGVRVATSYGAAVAGLNGS
eukprot:15024006-Heterocapsa_arctica.AAC.1